MDAFINVGWKWGNMLHLHQGQGQRVEPPSFLFHHFFVILLLLLSLRATATTKDGTVTSSKGGGEGKDAADSDRDTASSRPPEAAVGQHSNKEDKKEGESDKDVGPKIGSFLFAASSRAHGQQQQTKKKKTTKKKGEDTPMERTRATGSKKKTSTEIKKVIDDKTKDEETSTTHDGAASSSRVNKKESRMLSSPIKEERQAMAVVVKSVDEEGNDSSRRAKEGRGEEKEEHVKREQQAKAKVKGKGKTLTDIQKGHFAADEGIRLLKAFLDGAKLGLSKEVLAAMARQLGSELDNLLMPDDDDTRQLVHMMVEELAAGGKEMAPGDRAFCFNALFDSGATITTAAAAAGWTIDFCKIHMYLKENLNRTNFKINYFVLICKIKINKNLCKQRGQR
jgi:hypothetical protein